MKILTVNAEKGGVGKTTLTWNIAEYFAKTSRVLLIDLDEIRNLTNRYSLQNFPVENTIIPIFDETASQAVPITANVGLDLLAGSRQLKDIKQTLATKSGERYFLMKWLGKNSKQLEKKYDYILIDTHPDFSVLTDNALAVADIVLTMTQPSEDALIAMATEENHIAGLKDMLINPMTGESFVHARVVKIGNRIAHNTKESRNFLSQESEIEGCYLGSIQERSVVGIANSEKTPLIDLVRDDRYQTLSFKKFFSDTFEIFEALKKELER